MATGAVAALMDVVIVEMNKFLTSNIILLLVYPVIISFVAGISLKVDPSIGGPGIGYSVIHLKTKYYVPLKSAILKLVTSTLTLSGGFIAEGKVPHFSLEWQLVSGLEELMALERNLKICSD